MILTTAISNDVESNRNGTIDATSNGNAKTPVPMDPIQRAMGNFGRWHMIICCLIFLLKFPVAWHQMSIIFIGPNVDFRCSDNITNQCDASCPGYIYNRSIFKETIKMTWDLVCDRAYLADISQTIFMFGILIGNILFGTLADK